MGIKDAYLVGEYVYLRAPDLEMDILEGAWPYWFNDKESTKYLEQGRFPNTVKKQVDFLMGLENDPTRALLCIIDKSNDKHVGVISFRNIDYFNRKAEISIVIGEKRYPAAGPLEAFALMTEYGFDRLNLQKIYAGHVSDLWMWANTIALIGYRIEGYTQSMTIRDGKVFDDVHTGITAERFYRLRNERNGRICTEDVLALLRRRQKTNLLPLISDFFAKLYDEGKPPL